METPQGSGTQSQAEKQAETEARHQQNLIELHEKLAEFPADARFRNPNDPDGVDEHGQLVTLTVSEIMDICGPYIAGVKASMAFGIFERMYVKPEGNASLKLGQQAVSRPE